jgi:hypothetical protein
MIFFMSESLPVRKTAQELRIDEELVTGRQSQSLLLRFYNERQQLGTFGDLLGD